MQYTDLLLVDIKHIDEKSHKELTGKTNKNILDMIRFLSDIKNLSGSAMCSYRSAATMMNT